MSSRRLRDLAVLCCIILLVFGATYSGMAGETSKDSSHLEPEAIDHYVRSRMDSQRIPGLALAIIQDGEVAYTQGYGAAGPERSMSADTPLYIGSVSKAFTAVAVMQLVEAGQVDLDAPVQTYVPWFEIADPEGAAQITVRNLLNMNSGLAEDRYNPEFPDGTTLEEAVRDMEQAELAAPPGTEFNYTSPGYGVLGMLVKQVSGRTYAEYLRENIFDPLEMENSTAVPGHPLDGSRAQGHTGVFGFPVQRETQPRTWAAPSGFITSTAQDMSHFMLAMSNRGQYKDVQLLSSESVELLHTPDPATGSSYGMGWFVDEFNGEPLIHHGGDLRAFHAHAAILPEWGYGMVLLTNVNSLAHSLLAFPPLQDGIRQLLLDLPPSSGIPLSIVSWVLLVVVALLVIGDIRSFLGLREWLDQTRERPRSRMLLAIAWDAILPIGILLLVPIVLNATLLDGRFNWRTAFGPAPAIIGLLFYGVVIGALRAGVKLWLFFRRDPST